MSIEQKREDWITETRQFRREAALDTGLQINVFRGYASLAILAGWIALYADLGADRTRLSILIPALALLALAVNLIFMEMEAHIHYVKSERLSVKQIGDNQYLVESEMGKFDIFLEGLSSYLDRLVYILLAVSIGVLVYSVSTLPAPAIN